MPKGIKANITLIIMKNFFQGPIEISQGKFKKLYLSVYCKKLDKN